MTEPDDVLLGRDELERAFTALGERLTSRGVVADVFIVGGAAMALALAYDAQRVTRDVDAVFVPHGIVHEEAVSVAHDLGLPRWSASTAQSGLMYLRSATPEIHAMIRRLGSGARTWAQRNRPPARCRVSAHLAAGLPSDEQVSSAGDIQDRPPTAP
ncbi:MAG TPA: hypothetical protein VMA72_09830 [Streptosporangiaceae bacterium]|nr:hypothetical protein [Streptosporangiaceae bacterium]